MATFAKRRRTTTTFVASALGANLDFNNVLIGGLQSLLRQCVGIVDRAVYSGYLNGFEAGFLADIVDEQVFTTN